MAARDTERDFGLERRPGGVQGRGIRRRGSATVGGE